MNNSDETKIDEELMALAARLPTEVAPERDLWVGIEQEITQSRNRSRTSGSPAWAQAAAVVLLVAGSSGITYMAVKDDNPSVAGDDTTYLGPEVITPDQMFKSVLFEPVSGSFGQQYTLGNEYLAARDQLEGGLKENLDSMPKETRDDIVKNLYAVRVAIKEINDALVEEPDNTLLQDMLLSTYHDEISLMKKIDGIANSAMRRNDI